MRTSKSSKGWLAFPVVVNLALTSLAAVAAPAVANPVDTITSKTAIRGAKVAPGLRITIGQMPGGGVARVVITGPKQSKKAKKTYSRVIHKTTLLRSLAPGTYAVNAYAVAATGGTDIPLKASAKVKVKAKKQAKYTVNYRYAAAPVPATVPDAPSGIAASAGDASSTVSWAAPPDGGSAITSYQVVATAAGKTTRGCTANTGSPVDTSCTISGLVNAVMYTVTVVAHNAQGDSPVSSPVTVTPYTSPDVPTGVSATVETGSTTVSWTAPAFDGGAAITAYKAWAYDNDAGTFDTCVANTGNPVATSCQIQGLTGGVTYTIVVTAANARGFGNPSNQITVTPS